jgi:NTP pyrophosphatase (non-canonical NTP hydrolase)
MLIVSELSEALEADRKDKRANLNKYYQGIAHGDIYETYIKGTFEEEIADTFIRLFDLCGHLNIDIEKHIELKRIYNQSGNFKHDKKY